MKRVVVTPLDPVIFRDGRPFNSDHDMWANTMFPPSPSILYGLLRAVFFSRNLDELPNANSNVDPTRNLQICSSCIQVADGGSSPSRLILPLPRDYVVYRDGEEKKMIPFHLYTPERETTSCPTQKLLKIPSRIKAESQESVYMEASSIQSYLNGVKLSNCEVCLQNRLLSEPKIGIMINRTTGASQETMLYRAGMIRLSGLSFSVEYEGLELEQEGFIQVGGERRAGWFQHASDLMQFDKPVLEGSEQARIYLMTPAIFENGWIPSFMTASEKGFEMGDSTYRLLAAAVGKHQSIGGYSIQESKPKKMYRVVPQGSVYYIELIQGSWSEIIEKAHCKSISDTRAKEGFGVALVGGMKHP